MRTIVIMRFKVASGREAEFEEFMEQRSRSIKQSPGVRQVYLLKPLSSKENEYRLVSWWTELKDHDAWVRKEAYELQHSAAHPGIVVGTIPYEVAHVIREW